jgi:hypothetical protein
MKDLVDVLQGKLDHVTEYYAMPTMQKKAALLEILQTLVNQVELINKTYAQRHTTEFHLSSKVQGLMDYLNPRER